jgi:Flp pilus assembly protein TadB
MPAAGTNLAPGTPRFRPNGASLLKAEQAWQSRRRRAGKRRSHQSCMQQRQQAGVLAAAQLQPWPDEVQVRWMRPLQQAKLGAGRRRQGAPQWEAGG